MESGGPVPTWFYRVDVVLAWLLLVGGVVAALRALRAAAPRDRLAAIAVGFVALGARLAVPHGPHDCQARITLANRAFESVDWVYGLGMGPVGHIAHALLPQFHPRDDAPVHHLVAALGAGGCVALGAWLRVVGAPATAAWSAALALALATPMLFFGHTEAPFVPEAVLCVSGVLLASVHGLRPGWSAALGSVTAFALAAQMRPESPGAVALCLPVAFATSSRAAWRHPATWLGAVGLTAVVALHVAGMRAWLDAPGELIQGDTSLFQDGRLRHGVLAFGPEHLLLLDPAYTSRPLLVLAVAGVLLGHLPPRLRGLIAAVALGLALFNWYDEVTPKGARTLMFARNQLRSLPFFAALVGLGVDAISRLSPRPTARAAVAVFLVVGLAWTLPLNWRETTVLAEYRFLRAAIPSLPQGCTYRVLVDRQDGALVVSDYGFLLRVHGVADGFVGLEADAPPAPCEIYYRSGQCSTRQWPHEPPERCDSWEQRHRLLPLLETTLPAVGYAGEILPAEGLRVGFYRVEGAVERSPEPAAAP